MELSEKSLPRSIQRRSLDRFDGVMVVAMAALLAAIGLVVVRGDQLGIGLQGYGPSTGAASRTAIQLTFDEPIDPASVAPHWQIDPPVPGTYQTTNNQVIFKPALPLQPGKAYTVTVHAGLAANSGRVLKHDVQWQFQVRAPHVVFLGAEGDAPPNLYLLDPASGGAPRKLTDSTVGVASYDVAPDGSKIVYAELPVDAAASLFVWDATTGATSLLYACDQAQCSNLAWRPDGNAVAFQQISFDTVPGTGPDAARVWILDLATNSVHPLFSDNQQLGYMPRWSPEGARLAVFSVSAGGILVHDFTTGSDSLIPAVEGEVGTFSPDGQWLFFPKVVALGDGNYAEHVSLAHLSGKAYTQQDLEAADKPVNDLEAIWRVDSKGLIVTRQPAAHPISEGPPLYSVEVASGTAKLLVPGEAYRTDHLNLSPAGDALVFQRVALGAAIARPEVWMYNLVTHEIKHLADNGTIPRWIP